MSQNGGISWQKLDYVWDNSDVTEYNYPVNEREILDGTIRNSDNIYIASSAYRGSLINVEDSVFDTVTIEKGSNTIGYAFLAARPEVFIEYSKFPNGYSPSYAAGYTRVIWSGESEVTALIPDNARYLYIYNNSNDQVHVPAAIKFTKSGNEDTADENSVRIATWNIGHFSLGKYADTTISASDFDSKSAEYEDYLYKVLDADVITLNEYSADFTSEHKTRNTIFGEYTTAYEGEQRNYSCNAIYAKTGLTNIQTHEFECNKTADMESPYNINASDYYYVAADLTVNGKTVKVISTHLAFYAGSSENPPQITQNQIEELIGLYEDYDRVIIMGDWNCSPVKLQAFTDAGYNLANNDSTLATYPATQTSLDNMVYKGVTLSDFGLAGTKLSDHYAIYATITVD